MRPADSFVHFFVWTLVFLWRDVSVTVTGYHYAQILYDMVGVPTWVIVFLVFLSLLIFKRNFVIYFYVAFAVKILKYLNLVL